jgi:hypothetical protein
VPAGVTVKAYSEIFADLAAIDKKLPTITEPPAESKETKTAAGDAKTAAVAAAPKVCNKVWMDASKANMALFNSVTEKVRLLRLDVRCCPLSALLFIVVVSQFVLDKDSPIALLKAVKNEVGRLGLLSSVTKVVLSRVVLSLACLCSG